MNILETRTAHTGHVKSSVFGILSDIYLVILCTTSTKYSLLCRTVLCLYLGGRSYSSDICKPFSDTANARQTTV